ncbi:hypothetical protein CDEST_11232 [Colletotrichum destructivum]|uniref:Uncharacterized protein n=1 Tax=Colletotrichum destructivum TaxID=34406 RepID=A0AAX4ISM9_9PEZI|nr:hypothetical protein CDEST_11232 [Colletotrichum destructivum]
MGLNATGNPVSNRDAPTTVLPGAGPFEISNGCKVCVCSASTATAVSPATLPTHIVRWWSHHAANGNFLIYTLGSILLWPRLSRFFLFWRSYNRTQPTGPTRPILSHVGGRDLQGAPIDDNPGKLL